MTATATHDSGSAFPLSFAQEAMWFTSQFQEGAAAYQIQFAIDLRGSLDRVAFEQAWRAQIDRYDALRTAFVVDSLGKPRQLVRDQVSFSLEDADVSPGAALDDSLIVAVAASEARRPFDLAVPPLLRVKILEYDDARHVAIVTVHHLVADGPSIELLVKGLAEAYETCASGCDVERYESIPVYAEFALEQRERLARTEEQHQKYWRSRFAHEPPAVVLPGPLTRPKLQSFEGGAVLTTIDPTVWNDLTAFCRSTGITPFMFCLGVFTIVLNRYSGEADLTVGIPLTLRDERFAAEVGCFINTVPVRIDLWGDPTADVFFRRVRSAVLQALAHREYPFSRLIDTLSPTRDLSRSPLVQVMLSYQQDPMTTSCAAGLHFTAMSLPPATSELDLILDVFEHPEGATLTWQFAKAVLGEHTVRRMAETFALLGRQVVARPEVRIEELYAASEADVMTLRKWNATRHVFPDGDGSINDLVEEWARETPTATAVLADGGRMLSYRELVDGSAQVAAKLFELGVRAEGRVAVQLERSTELVTALLGVLRAQAAYVPLDPDYPAARVAYMLDDCRPMALITKASEHSAPTAVRTLDIERILADVAVPDVSHIPAPLPRNAAYVIYTSGSTGAPKGAVNEHRAVINRLLWMRDHCGVVPQDRILQKTPYSFDVSVWEFFLPIISGARLVLARPGGHRDPCYLSQLMRDTGVTIAHFVPSMLTQFLDVADADDCPDLRYVVCSGESLPAATRDRFFEKFPETRLDNLYGPTEAAVDVTAWTCHRSDGPSVPIGRPVANTAIYVLDCARRPVPIGVAGELYIAGDQVGRGYFRRPGLTAERFPPDPFAGDGARMYATGDIVRHREDGAIEFLGRSDDQVKLNGIRIELGEIERVLRQQPTVRDAAVMMAGSGSKEGDANRLLAYCVASSPRVRPSARELRAALGEWLPAAMVPAVFVWIDTVPLTPSGKLDRKALPSPSHDDKPRPVRNPPSSDTEKLIAEIWTAVLTVRDIDASDNFFDLGGDSIRTIQVVSRARAVGLDLGLQDLFEYETLEDLAAAADSRPRAADRAEKIEPFALISPGDWQQIPGEMVDAYPVGRLQLGMIFHSEFDESAATYIDVAVYDVEADFVRERFEAAVAAVVEANAVLRTAFDLASFSEPLQLVHPSALVAIRYVDAREKPVAEQMKALASAVESVKSEPFELERAPLFRLSVIQRDPSRFWLVLAFHHAILDGWSLELLPAALFGAYERTVDQAAAVQPPSSDYNQFIALEQRALHSPAARRHWKRELRGMKASPLPRTGCGDGQLEPEVLPVDVTLMLQELTEVARGSGVSLKHVLLAAHLRVLAAATGEREVLTGVVGHGRPETPGSEERLGLYLNTLPFRLSVESDTWANLIRGVFDKERKHLEFRHFPFAEIQRLAPRAPLSDSAFYFTNFHNRRSQGDGWKMTPVAFYEKTNLPYLCVASVSEVEQRVFVRVAFQPQLFATSHVRAMSGLFADVLRAVAADPQSDPWLPLRHDRAVHSFREKINCEAVAPERSVET